MSNFFDTEGGDVAFQERRAWIMLATTTGTYLAYLAIVLAGAAGGPLTAAP